MALNVVIPLSIVMELSILIWQIVLHEYAKSPLALKIWSSEYFRILNDIFFGAIIFSLLMSIYWVWYFWKESREFNSYVKTFRMIQGVVFIVALIFWVLNIAFVLIHCKFQMCETYEIKVVASGFLFVFFGFVDVWLYFSVPINIRAPVYPDTILPAQSRKSEKVVVEGFDNFFPSFPAVSLPEKEYSIKG